ncbi:alpha/beta fold hydrolase [Vibrio sp.]|uniref:alpha/beta fold hydrolase n=1 Tax=Vibrio sp. TaxID=678 RepID=UPI003D0EA336
MTEYRHDGQQGDPLFIFAHGAGADMDHEFMSLVASELAKHGIRVLRFNFPYMVKRAEDGKKRPPDRAPKLLEAFAQVIEQQGDRPVVIGGKSMGGRMASLLSDHPQVAGIACLGFPFHPPGKADKWKGDHLTTIDKPTLILQGERDTFGNREELEPIAFSSAVSMHWLADGDHSFNPRKRSGYTLEQNIEQAAEKLAGFIDEVYHAQS